MLAPEQHTMLEMYALKRIRFLVSEATSLVFPFRKSRCRYMGRLSVCTRMRIQAYTGASAFGLVLFVAVMCLDASDEGCNACFKTATCTVVQRSSHHAGVHHSGHVDVHYFSG